MSYVFAAKKSDIAAGQMKGVTVGGTKVLIANIGGAYSAIPDKCPHLGGSLCAGRLEGTEVVCPKHGASFDVVTGKAVKPAKVLVFSIKPKDAKSLPVRLDGDDVMVEV